LAAVTSLVATQTLNLTAVALVILYALGSALPLLAFAIFGQKLIRVSRFLGKHLESIRRIFGAIMIGASLLMVFDLDAQFVQSALKFVPVISADTNAQVRAELQKLKPAVKTDVAPEFKDNQAWINSPPLTMASLRGKVVLVDFWTYSCINCLRTLPYLKRWYDTYKDDGFVIVGVHTPEFEFEKDEDNVKRATERLGIRYPVALDNNYATWDAFANDAWPGHYLIDRDGIIRERHLGEGDYQETEEHIRELLNKTPGAAPVQEPTFSRKLTPETYLGYARAEAYDFELVRDRANRYAQSETPGPNKVSLRGEFIVGKESVVAGDDAELILNFNASQVYLVLSGFSDVPMRISLDDKEYGQLLIKEPRMYEIVDLKNELGRHLLKLEIPKDISAYAFTFGGG
jgi:thiol-disulfide isomerase/thioredoxin